ncbi:CPH2 [[Candida] subhashii]|uniref:CPH2 n=1 Tax=[Candida] subhashii TaxID=561895 RepID=A0A8J5QL78_9ASCO|nr:CPH2 [[Candida] subhashii]KAG7662482.1 CPH2 [[Candida] subhashii]
MSQFETNAYSIPSNMVNNNTNNSSSFFDFETADEFLDCISGTLPHQQQQGQSTDDHLQADQINNIINASSLYSPLSMDGDEKPNSNNHYTNGPSATSYTSDNSLDWNDYNNNVMVDNELEQILSGTSNHSTSSPYDDITPVSNPSYGSSTYTSPEPLHVKGEPSQETLQPPSGKNGRKKSTSKKSNGGITKPKSKDKNSHNMIEKKYRTNINSKIVALRDAVPSLRIAAGSNDVSVADLEGLSPASKLNKASVLTKATEYIKHLENKNAMLKESNYRLQRMIQEASLSVVQAPIQIPPPPMHPQQQHVPLPPQAPQQQEPIPTHQEFFHPQQQPQQFNTSPHIQQQQQQQFQPQFIAQTQQVQAQQQAQQQQQPNKFLLGGMAAVMGTSLFGGSGENDFRSLAALPFSHLFPNALLHPSPLTISLWNFTKVLLVIGSLASIVLPILAQAGKKVDEKKKKESGDDIDNGDVFTNWLLIKFGFKLPHKLSKNRRDSIMYHLTSGSKFSWNSLINDYFYLSNCELEFETCFLTLLIGRLLLDKYPMSKTLINHSLIIRGSLIPNLNYKGSDDGLTKLNKLIKNIDGISMFGSKPLITRLKNVAQANLVNSQLVNDIRYIKLYQESSGYYEMIYNFRMAELIDELNYTYLDSLASKDEKLQEQLVKDLESLVKNVEKDDAVFEYCRLFDAVVNNNAKDLFNDLKEKVENQLQRFKVEMEGVELTDHEIYNTSDEEAQDSDNDSVILPPKPKPSLSSQKSLIDSLDIISQEEFIILTCEFILHFKSNDQVSKLLKYLSKIEKFNVLSFTALFKLTVELNEIDDNLIRICRGWLDDSEVLDGELKNEIVDVVVKKGMILNGVVLEEN